MSALEASPADWLRDLLEAQPGVSEASFDLPPNQDRIVVVTSAGLRFNVSVVLGRNYTWAP